MYWQILPLTLRVIPWEWGPYVGPSIGEAALELWINKSMDLNRTIIRTINQNSLKILAHTIAFCSTNRAFCDSCVTYTIERHQMAGLLVPCKASMSSVRLSCDPSQQPKLDIDVPILHIQASTPIVIITYSFIFGHGMILCGRIIRLERAFGILCVKKNLVHLTSIKIASFISPTKVFLNYNLGKDFLSLCSSHRWPQSLNLRQYIFCIIS